MIKVKALIVRFFKFGIVGTINTLVFFAIYYGLLFLGAHYILAHTSGFLIATGNAFYLNRKFVFKPDESKSKVKQLIKVFGVYFFSLLLGIALLTLMVEVIGISERIAPILILFVTIPLNFVLNEFWAFK